MKNTQKTTVNKVDPKQTKGKIYKFVDKTSIETEWEKANHIVLA